MISERSPINTPPIYFWRVRTRLPERFGQHCVVIARGSMNSCRVRFGDGVEVITSRNYLRRVTDDRR